MKIALIGSGNVAWHLGEALHAAGHELVAVYSPTEANRQELAHALAPAIPVSSPDLSGTGAELVIIAIPDATLATIKDKVVVPVNAIVVHTSGSQPLAVLQGIGGAKIGVFYPLQTFSKSKAVDFRNVPLLLEAQDEDTLKILKAVATSISGQVHEVDSAMRKQLHLAAVFACNFTNHLLGISRELLQQAALPPTLLQPLIQETIAKAMLHPPFQVQTGPAVRNDQNVIEEHLRMLEQHPQYRQLYLILTQSIQNQHRHNSGSPS